MIQLCNTALVYLNGEIERRIQSNNIEQNSNGVIKYAIPILDQLIEDGLCKRSDEYISGQKNSLYYLSKKGIDFCSKDKSNPYELFLSEQKQLQEQENKMRELQLEKLANEVRDYKMTKILAILAIIISIVSAAAKFV